MLSLFCYRKVNYFTPNHQNPVTDPATTLLCGGHTDLALWKFFRLTQIPRISRFSLWV